jgi:hypothetical protein
MNPLCTDLPNENRAKIALIRQKYGGGRFWLKTQYYSGEEG